MSKNIPLFFLLLLFFLTTIHCLAQTPRPLTAADSVEIDEKVRLAAKEVKKKLEQDPPLLNEGLHTEFSVDTFKIEERMRLQLEIDYSTNGMVMATLAANREYDQLLNKYYKRLLKSLNSRDRKVLRLAQRNWIIFRDSEMDFNGALLDPYYSGGGTMHRVLAVARVLELTKNRTIELYQYIGRKAE